MRPERFSRLASRSARGLRGVGIILLVLIAIDGASTRGTESALQAAPRSTYDAQSFLQELARLKGGLESARKTPEALSSFRNSLPAAWAVDAGGRHFEVSTSQLASHVQRAERDSKFRDQQLQEASQYLEALAEETASISAEPAPNTDFARAKLKAILAHPEYARTREKTWREKLQDRIDEIILDLLTGIFRRVGGQSAFGYALLWIGISAAAILIALSIFRQWVGRAWGQEMALAAAAAPALSWQEWIFAARGAAERADYRVAIHCAYWAAIARLQDLGSIAPDRAKTPREYLHALTKSKLLLPETLAARQQALSTLTSKLEKTWYGYQAATEADFRDSVSQLETLGCDLP